MKKSNAILLLSILAVFVIGAGVGTYFIFFHRAAAAPYSSSTGLNGQQGRGFGGYGGSNGSFGSATGTIASDNNNTVIVNDSSGGGQTTVIVSSTTHITKSETISESSILQTGTEVTVTGTKSGTSIIATAVTERPATQRPSGVPAQGSGGFGGGFRGGSRGGSSLNSNTTTGQITAISSSGFTIESFNGTSYTVSTSVSTKYTTEIAGSLTDIAAGQSIIAFGQSSGGTITAVSVTIE